MYVIASAQLVEFSDKNSNICQQYESLFTQQRETERDGVGGRVDSAFDSCLKNMGSNPAEAGHYVTTVGKLFTPTVLSGAEGWLN